MIGGASSNPSLQGISMARKQCQSAASPPRCGWKPISMVATAPCCCVTITIANWCASKAHRLAAGSLVRLAQRLFEDFLSSDFFRIGDDAPSMAADTDEVVDASFGESRPAGSGTAPSRRGLPAVSANSPEALLARRPPTRCRIWPRRSRYRTSAAGAGRQRRGQDHPGAVQIKVDDLKRQIESEAKRGDKPFEGEIGVSPRQGMRSAALSWPQRTRPLLCRVGHFPDRSAEEGEGLAANLLRRYGLTPQTLRQQVSKVVGKGAGMAAPETPTNTPELDKYSRDLTKMAREGASSIRSSAARRSRRPSSAGQRKKTTRC